MKIKGIALAVVLLVVAAAAAFYLFRGSGGGSAKEAPVAAQPPSGPHAGHGGAPPPPPAPEVQQPARPSAEPAGETPRVEIPADKRQLIGVKTEKARVMALKKSVATVGRVDYDERRLATVTVKFEGWIEKLWVDYTGKQIRKGDPLAAIYSPELLATQREFLQFRKKRAEKPDDFLNQWLAADALRIAEAARQRLSLWDISAEQIRGIEETGEPVRTLTLFSPAGGTVVAKNALLGMRVMPGDKLFDIADVSTVWIVADVHEQDLALIKAGQEARVTVEAFPGRTFTAAVDFVYPSLSGETRTAKIRLSLPNPGSALKPQMYTRVSLAIDLGRRLVVPEDAVLDTGERRVVYVDRGEDQFEPREVMTGLRADGYREITRGLKAGESVAVAANFLIDSEAQLKGVRPLGGFQR